MLPDQTPFRTGWWGQDLPGLKPRHGTYGLCSYEELPPVPFVPEGDFHWLVPPHSRRGTIADERAAENKQALPALLDDCRRRLSQAAQPMLFPSIGQVAENVSKDAGAPLPPPFIRFMQSPDLQSKIRSCTDCFLDLSSALLPIPHGNDYLVRFLADSQGVLFWYLYFPPVGSDHCVVVSPDFYGLPDEQFQDEPPDPNKIIFCAESFETFLWRFWIENEIWYCGYEKRPMFPAGQAYLDAYRSPQ